MVRLGIDVQTCTRPKEKVKKLIIVSAAFGAGDVKQSSVWAFNIMAT